MVSMKNTRILLLQFKLVKTLSCSVGYTKNCSTFKLVSGKKLPSILLFQQVPILPPDCCNSTKTMACLNQTSLGNNLTIANPRHGLGEWTLPLLSTLTLALVGDPTKDTVSYVNNKIILQNRALPVNTCSGPINFVLGNLTTTTDMLPSPFRELTFPLN